MNRFLGKFPIGFKLGGSFVIIVLVLAATITLSYFDMRLLNNGMTSLYFDHTVPIQEMGEVKALVEQIKSNTQLYLQIPQVEADKVDGPQCGSCHVNEATGTHHLEPGKLPTDATRCLTCHTQQAEDPQHGRALEQMTNNQECSSCHSAEVITQQHTEVEQEIKLQAGRINEIVDKYRVNPLLTAEERSALASFDTAWKNYQTIVSDLIQKSKEGGSKESLHRVVGGDAHESQHAVEDAIDSLVAINQNLGHSSQEDGASAFGAASLRLMLAGIAGLFLASGLGYVITQNLRNPVDAMARGLNSMQQGVLRWDVPETLKAEITQRADELGVAGKGFDNTVQYLQEMASVANRIASGDLTVQVSLRSEDDELGLSFSRMVTSLQNLVSTLRENASLLTSSAKLLANNSNQTGESSRQIAITIQQVAQGIAQQTSSVTKTSASVEQMGRAIDGVAKGAQEQARAMTNASKVAAEINSSIEQVANNAQAVTRDSAQAASYSREGAKTVMETLEGMKSIREKVGFSASKVEEMGARSEKIGDIIETIEDIASQTNLLALNAAIEAARAKGSGSKISEQLIQQHLLGVAGLLAEVCLTSSQPLQIHDLITLAKRANVGTLNITDADGMVVLSNDPTSVGFRFPEDPKQQASVFRALLHEKDGILAQPAQPRSQDGVLYIYAGVSRRDQPGVVQAGMSAEVIETSGNYTRGFAVVADEVRKLAERSSLATKEIAVIIKDIQSTVGAAVKAMHASAGEVESGVTRASSAGDALKNILGAAESVYKQAEEAGSAAAKVRAAAFELVESVDAVSAVIEQNTAATEQMSANSSELTQAIENIASVSEENSAAVEEVSASTEEVSAQVDEVSTSASALTDMAQKLQQSVAHFKLPGAGQS